MRRLQDNEGRGKRAHFCGHVVTFRNNFPEPDQGRLATYKHFRFLLLTTFTLNIQVTMPHAGNYRYHLHYLTSRHMDCRMRHIIRLGIS